MTSAPLPPDPPAAASGTAHRDDRAPGAHSAPGDRFFAWAAGLGVVRGDGWLGGVAAGLAARMRVDPLIVRGILVVTGLFGFPVLFAYAIAWALLPDLDGRIPLQEAVRGRFTPALIGIAACAVLGLLPMPVAITLGMPSLSVLGASSFGLIGVAVTPLAVLIAAALIVIIVRAAVRTPRLLTPAASVPDQHTASAVSLAADSSVPSTGSGPVDASDRQGKDAADVAASTPALFTATDDSVPVRASDGEHAPAGPEAPPAPPLDSDEYAAWREQHAAWKLQDAAWRREQQDAARAARDQARRERQERGAAFSAEAAERRRIRRARAPRTSFAFVAVAMGLAVILGTAAAMASGSDLAVATGIFVAAVVSAASMIVAGAARRRSGFLAFLTTLLLLAGGAATALPTARVLHLGAYGISNLPGSADPAAGEAFVQPWGTLTVTIVDTGEPTRPLIIDKRSGWIYVMVDEGVALTVDITAPREMIMMADERGDAVSLDALTVRILPDGRARYTGTLLTGQEPPTTSQTLVIDQRADGTQIQTMSLTEDEQ